MLVIGPWQLRLLICASAVLLVAIVVGMMAADVSRQRRAFQADRVQQNMSDLQDYRMKTIQWWSDLQGGRDPGLAPKAPALTAGAVDEDLRQLWIAAVRDSGGMLFFLATASLAALAILWLSGAQRRRPIRADAVRLVSGLVYLYAAVALLIASVAVGEFILN